MENAKQEIINHIGEKKVEYVKVVFTYLDLPNEEEINWNTVKLETINASGRLEEVLQKLDHRYDSGYGSSQYLFGYIWYTDGTWSERNEYDGAEEWVHKFRPNQQDNINSKQP